MGRSGVHKREVDLVRLLVRCEALMSRREVEPLPKTHKDRLLKFVNVLREELAILHAKCDKYREKDLPSNVNSTTLPHSDKQPATKQEKPNDTLTNKITIPARKTLDEYEKRIQAVAEWLSREGISPHNELRAQLLQMPSPQPSVADTPTPTPAPVPVPASQPQPDLPSSQKPLETPKKQTAPTPTTTSAKRQASTPVKRTAREEHDLLDMNTKQQNAISDDLVMLTRELKTHVIEMQKVVHEDLDRLDVLDELTQNNVVSIKRERKTLAVHASTSANHTCWMWLIILIVALLFVWMVFFMRLFPKKHVITKTVIEQVIIHDKSDPNDIHHHHHHHHHHADSAPETFAASTPQHHDTSTRPVT